MRDFREYSAYIKGLNLASSTYKLTRFLPKHELYALGDQMRRAAVSIPSNIAEGAGRKSSKEFAKFLRYGLSSSYELETQLLIAKKQDYLDEELAKEFAKELCILQRELGAFIRSVENTN